MKLNYQFLLILLVISILITKSSNAQIGNSDWKITGQIQLRSELDDRDFRDLSYGITTANMRIRLGVQKNISDSILFFTQFQDSRVFGYETNTTTNMANIDLHQGYVKLKKPIDLPFDVQFGRFELAYGTERFIGAVGWNYIGRSFDGAKFSFDVAKGLDLFALTVNDIYGYTSVAPTVSIQNKSPNLGPTSIYGAWLKNELDNHNKLDLFAYYELNQNKIVTDTIAPIKVGNMFLKLLTLGSSYWGQYQDLGLIFEGAYQMGSKSNLDVSSYLVSLVANYKIGDFKPKFGYDILSGTSVTEKTKYNSFRSVYGTNHAFYGYMDYFIDVPTQTKGLGLNDLYLGISWSPKESKFNLDLSFHKFNSNQKDANGNNSFGNEIDFTSNYQIYSNAKFVWGASVFMPNEIMKTFFTPNKDNGYWTYLMLVSNF